MPVCGSPGAAIRAGQTRTRDPCATRCLFAALKVHAGEVLAMPSRTRERGPLRGLRLPPSLRADMRRALFAPAS
jgi:hypothetical protein